jgi:hypothetical protein
VRNVVSVLERSRRASRIGLDKVIFAGLLSEPMVCNQLLRIPRSDFTRNFCRVPSTLAWRISRSKEKMHLYRKCAWFVLNRRKSETEGCALALFGLYPDLSTLALNKLPAERQANSTSWTIGSM